MLYILTLDESTSQFIKSTWLKASKKDPYRGFKSDTPESEPIESKRKSAATKVSQLELMLGQIANFAPIVSRKSIVERSTSLESVWQLIRAYFGFQTSGSYFLDFADIQLKEGERPEALYQRLISFVEDNLLTVNGVLSHHGDKIEEDEELSPTLENMIVLIWLKLVNKDLPKLVKQKYGTELRTKTLASIKPEISAALDSLLNEITANNTSARVMRSGATVPYNNNSGTRPKSQYKPTKSSKAFCALCHAKKKPSDHFLSKCRYLPDTDRKFFTKVRIVTAIDSALDNMDLNDSEEVVENEGDECYGEDGDEYPRIGRVSHDIVSKLESDRIPTIKRVEVGISPWFNVFYEHQAVTITIDTGAMISLIKESVAVALCAKIRKTSQGAHQLDGKSPLKVVGETTITFKRNDMPIILHALVCTNMEDEILAGTPFTKLNGIDVLGRSETIVFSDGTTFRYIEESPNVSRCTPAQLVRSVVPSTTIFPGQYLECGLPEEFHDERVPVAIEPRSTNSNSDWVSPMLVKPVNGKIRIVNSSTEPKKVVKGQHICQVMHSVPPKITQVESMVPSIKKLTVPKNAPYSATIEINEKKLSPDIVAEFKAVNSQFDEVFNPSIGCYNGNSGDIKGVVNMGPVLPPQRKGRVPQYSRNRMEEVQMKCDELEAMGVLAKPETVGVVAEYLNPSFLVKKPSGGSRLVTAFSEVAKYAKPQPSLMPNVDSTLRQIGQWKYIITTDLQKAFYQIPLSHDSIKYCGIATPFKGIRVYLRCAMGLPGSETALEELMSRILGEFVREGFVAKVADDLYVGADDQRQLLLNWIKVLQALRDNGVSLSAPKTLIAPLYCIMLGWKWQDGTITATSHRISTLSTCPLPKTVKGLRSFLGAYKFLSRVLPRCSTILSPLEELIAGKASAEKLVWSSEMESNFDIAKKHLSEAKTVSIPKRSDKLWIITDGCQNLPGIGAALFLTRGSKQHLAGYYSAKLRKRQLGWIPCEIEALAIGAAVTHYSPYIIQSSKVTSVLSDSQPCVDAFQKLCRGEFSLSARVTTFLSIISRYQCDLKHISGVDNPLSDYQSRNAVACDIPTCQVCTFVSKMESSAIRAVRVKDVIDGTVNVPYTSRAAWRMAQDECIDCRQAKAQLKQGTRPSKKVTDRRDLKQYLRYCTLARDGLLIVRKEEPFMATVERIVVPRSLAHGLATALHLKFDHPTPNQLKLIMKRSFYAIAIDQVIDDISDKCSECAALRSIPNHLIEQSTESPPYAIGITYAGDVLRREKQMIFILREYVTSYIQAIVVQDEKHDSLRSAIILLVSPLQPASGPTSVVRVDPAPGFRALRDDEILLRHGIAIEMGREKNPNKNPVAERAVQEFEIEVAKYHSAKVLSPVDIMTICTRINHKIRHPGLSSKEMLTKRDQFSNKQLPIDDCSLIIAKHNQHLENHRASERSKAKRPAVKVPDISVGDLVHLACDPISKGVQRDRYIVASVDGEWCNVRKLTETQLRSMSYRVRLNQCYLVPCYQHTAKKRVSFEDDLEETSSAEPQFQLPSSYTSTISPMSSGTLNNVENQEQPSTSEFSEETAASDNNMLTDDSASVATPPELETPYVTAHEQPTKSVTATIEPRRSSKRQPRKPRYLEDYEC